MQLRYEKRKRRRSHFGEKNLRKKFTEGLNLYHVTFFYVLPIFIVIFY